mmetsp:Transcript_18046/g.39308  ORF Transcript_18046/g.39308 Transcript_18046/m.39308 type:complete len:856 (+) Transcript_18046:95-2662(+)
MPLAAELEEFGLEVEEEEHHSLVADSEVGIGHVSAPSRRHALSLTTPSKEQRSLLQSSNNFSNTTRLLRPGILKWATLVLALAIVVFVHLGQERDETEYVELTLPDVEICQDDPEFTLMVRSEKNCATFVSHVGKQPLLEARCNQPIGIPDEDDFQKLLKHFCRRSCGLCGSEDALLEEGAMSEAEIEKEVEEVAEEIEEMEKEMMEEVEKVIEKDLAKEEEEKKEQLARNREEDDDDDDDDDDDGEGVALEDEEASEDDDEEGEDEEVSNDDEEEETDQSTASKNKQPSAASKEVGAVKVNDSNSKNLYKPTKTNNASANNNGGDFGTFTLRRLQETRKATQTLIQQLEQYYNGKPQATRMMFDSWLKPWKFQNSNSRSSRDRNDKLIDTIARALVTEDQEEFIIGTIGSSVAAGHDNCHYDSYENQLERTFGPVWNAAGMKLVTQNAGEGGGCGDDYRNQAYCIAQNVSPNVDIAHYTWTYFEEGDRVEKYKIRESLVRWTQRMERQPPVHVLNVLWAPTGNDLRVEQELADHYAKYGYNAFYMRTGHTLGGYDYEADKKNGIDHYAAGFQGDGYHNVTRYGLKEENSNRRDSLGVVMRNWHPGPLGFEFVSDTFSYVYSKAMIEALDLIEAQMATGKDPRQTWSSSQRTISPKESLPEPKHCDPAYCVVDKVPGCLNFEKPTFGLQGAEVEDAEGSLNPHKGEVQDWKVWYENIDIWHMVGKQDKAIFQKRDDKEICRHLDQCGGLSATSSEDGTVVFRLPEMEVGLVVICGCCGKDVARTMFLQNEFLEISYNGIVLDKSKWDIFPNAKCVRLQEKFPTELAGQAYLHSYLSVKALDGLKAPVRISHVITL